MNMKLKINCCMCREETQFHCDILPQDWEHDTGVIFDSHAWCPHHKAIKDFSDTQCPGCTGIWKDCALWRAFDNTDKSLLKILQNSLNLIREGHCPFRMSGSVDIGLRPYAYLSGTEPASIESGEALAKFIEDKQHERKDT